MCARVGVTAEAGDLGEVEGELVLEPVDGVAGLAGEDSDEVVARELASLHSECKWRRGSVCVSFILGYGGTDGLTERFVSSKNCFALSGMPSSC